MLVIDVTAVNIATTKGNQCRYVIPEVMAQGIGVQHETSRNTKQGREFSRPCFLVRS